MMNSTIFKQTIDDSSIEENIRLELVEKFLDNDPSLSNVLIPNSKHELLRWCASLLSSDEHTPSKQSPPPTLHRRWQLLVRLLQEFHDQCPVTNVVLGSLERLLLGVVDSSSLLSPVHVTAFEHVLSRSTATQLPIERLCGALTCVVKACGNVSNLYRQSQEVDNSDEHQRASSTPSQTTVQRASQLCVLLAEFLGLCTSTIRNRANNDRKRVQLVSSLILPAVYQQIDSVCQPLLATLQCSIADLIYDTGLLSSVGSSGGKRQTRLESIVGVCESMWSDVSLRRASVLVLPCVFSGIVSPLLERHVASVEAVAELGDSASTRLPTAQLRSSSSLIESLVDTLWRQVLKGGESDGDSADSQSTALCALGGVLRRYSLCRNYAPNGTLDTLAEHVAKLCVRDSTALSTAAHVFLPLLTFNVRFVLSRRRALLWRYLNRRGTAPHKQHSDASIVARASSRAAIGSAVQAYEQHANRRHVQFVARGDVAEHDIDQIDSNVLLRAEPSARTLLHALFVSSAQARQLPAAFSDLFASLAKYETNTRRNRLTQAETDEITTFPLFDDDFITLLIGLYRNCLPSQVMNIWRTTTQTTLQEEPFKIDVELLQKNRSKAFDLCWSIALTVVVDVLRIRSTQKDNVEADLKKIWNDWLKPTLQQWPASSSDDDKQRSDKKRKRKRAASEDSAVSVSDLVALIECVVAVGNVHERCVALGTEPASDDDTTSSHSAYLLHLLTSPALPQLLSLPNSNDARLTAVGQCKFKLWMCLSKLLRCEESFLSAEQKETIETTVEQLQIVELIGNRFECSATVATTALRHVGTLCRSVHARAVCDALLDSPHGAALLADAYVHELRVARAPLGDAVLAKFTSLIQSAAVDKKRKKSKKKSKKSKKADDDDDDKAQKFSEVERVVVDLMSQPLLSVKYSNDAAVGRLAQLCAWCSAVPHQFWTSDVAFRLSGVVLWLCCADDEQLSGAARLFASRLSQQQLAAALLVHYRSPVAANWSREEKGEDDDLFSVLLSNFPPSQCVARLAPLFSQLLTTAARRAEQHAAAAANTVLSRLSTWLQARNTAARAKYSVVEAFCVAMSSAGDASRSAESCASLLCEMLQVVHAAIGAIDVQSDDANRSGVATLFRACAAVLPAALASDDVKVARLASSLSSAASKCLAHLLVDNASALPTAPQQSVEYTSAAAALAIACATVSDSTNTDNNNNNNNNNDNNNNNNNNNLVDDTFVSTILMSKYDAICAKPLLHQSKLRPYLKNLLQKIIDILEQHDCEERSFVNALHWLNNILADIGTAHRGVAVRRILDRLLSCAGALSLRSSTRLEALHILEALVCDVHVKLTVNQVAAVLQTVGSCALLSDGQSSDDATARDGVLWLARVLDGVLRCRRRSVTRLLGLTVCSTRALLAAVFGRLAGVHRSEMAAAARVLQQLSTRELRAPFRKSVSFLLVDLIALIERVPIPGECRQHTTLAVQHLLSMCTDFEFKQTFKSLNSVGKGLFRSYLSEFQAEKKMK